MPRPDLFSDRLPAAGNRLIAALPPKDRSRLLASGEEVDLVFEKTLVEPGGRIRHVYFPTDHSYISLVTPVDGATGLEVERPVGITHFEPHFGGKRLLRDAARVPSECGWFSAFGHQF